MAYKSNQDRIANDKARANHKRAVVARWKRMKGCADCGYNEHSAALEFDHLGGKERTVASLMYASWELIKNEIAKCDVVCSNCHAIRSYNRSWHK